MVLVRFAYLLVRNLVFLVAVVCLLIVAAAIARE
jgi:hypothetical protein